MGGWLCQHSSADGCKIPLLDVGTSGGYRVDAPVLVVRGQVFPDIPQLLGSEIVRFRTSLDGSDVD